MWHTQLGDRVLEGKEAAFYLLAAQETVALLQELTPEEIECCLPPTFDTVFDQATSEQKIVLLDQVLLALLNPSISQPNLTNVVEAAAYLPFQVMKLKVEEEIDLGRHKAWDEEERDVMEFWYRRLILETYQSLNWKIYADIERPKVRNPRSTNVDLWIAAIEALANRIFWDDDWKITSQCPEIFEGKHPEAVQWGGLKTYLTSQLPQVNNAQVVMAAQAIQCWQLPTVLPVKEV